MYTTAVGFDACMYISRRTESKDRAFPSKDEDESGYELC